MRITSALYKYMGGAVHRRFDWLLIAAGLYTSERDCLVRLFGMSNAKYRDGQQISDLHKQQSEIYEALYGELDRRITGEKHGNMWEEMKAIDYNSWETPEPTEFKTN